MVLESFILFLLSGRGIFYGKLTLYNSLSLAQSKRVAWIQERYDYIFWLLKKTHYVITFPLLDILLVLFIYLKKNPSLSDITHIT